MNKKLNQEAIKIRGRAAMEKDKKSELEEVLIDAIDKTRLQIFKRKLAQDKGSQKQEMIKRVKQLGNEFEIPGQGNSINPDDTAAFSQIEPTLVRLNEYINSRIKISDFTVADKANLVELFVTHQRTLMQIYMSIFPQTQNIDRKYENLNVTHLSTAQPVTASDPLNDPSLYLELLEGDINDRSSIGDYENDQRDMSSLFENRSISEIA